MRPLPLVLALAIATPAHAELTVTARYGGWDVFHGVGTDGRQVCGIGTTNPTDGRAFSLRFATGDDGITFIADKPSWNIPEGTEVPVVMQVGLDQPWTEQGSGHADRLTWSMPRATVPLFDAQFRRASSMTLTFPAGNEQPWIVTLRGSSAASDAMGRCVTGLTQAGTVAAPPAGDVTTQPFGTAPTAPATPAPAAPVTSPAPTR
jgi:hypothetical protein